MIRNLMRLAFSLQAILLLGVPCWGSSGTTLFAGPGSAGWMAVEAGQQEPLTASAPGSPAASDGRQAGVEAAGEDAYQQQVAAIVREEMERQGIPGVSVGVVSRGKVLLEQGYGLANLEHSVPATAETIYQSGSIGKQFTASLVLLLEADGRLSLEDPVSKHLPGTPPEWKAITIRNLLNHTSGLGDPYHRIDLRKAYSETELLALEAELPLDFPPGTDWSYSNSGYHVLGFLCSHLGGKFYGEQLQERIFGPAGMKTARIINEQAIIPHRAAGYERDPETERLVNQAWVSPELNTTADGSLYLSVRDWNRWMLVLDGESVLSADQKERLWQPAVLKDGRQIPYGLGWGLEPLGEHPCVSHGGAWQGFTTYLIRIPGEGLSVTVLTNSADGDPGKIAERIARISLPKTVP